MSDDSTRVVARFISKPGSVEEVKRILSDMVGPTRSEEGCITYELLHNVADPTDFTFVEEWSSRAHLDRHSGSEHLRIGRELIKEHLAESSDIRIYTLVK